MICGKEDSKRGSRDSFQLNVFVKSNWPNQIGMDNGVKNEAVGELGGIEIMCGCLRLVFAKGQSY